MLSLKIDNKYVVTTRLYNASCMTSINTGYHSKTQISLGKYEYHYKTDKSFISWFGAEQECQKIHGHLLSMHSQEEVDEIRRELIPITYSPAVYFGLQIMVSMSSVIPITYSPVVCGVIYIY